MPYERTLFLSVLAIALVEMALWVWWVPWYFRYGVPIFRTRRVGISGLPPEDQLDKQLSERGVPWFAYRRFSPLEIGFREPIWGTVGMHYTPVMHGFIRHVPEEGAVYVTGFVDWYSAAFLGFFILMTGGHPGNVFLLFIIGIMAAIYAVQARRYRKLADALAAD